MPKFTYLLLNKGEESSISSRTASDSDKEMSSPETFGLGILSAMLF